MEVEGGKVTFQGRCKRGIEHLVKEQELDLAESMGKVHESTVSGG